MLTSMCCWAVGGGLNGCWPCERRFRERPAPPRWRPPRDRAGRRAETAGPRRSGPVGTAGRATGPGLSPCGPGRGNDTPGSLPPCPRHRSVKRAKRDRSWLFSRLAGSQVSLYHVFVPFLQTCSNLRIGAFDLCVRYRPGSCREPLVFT